jgi:alcohol dehydrogenase class IV
MQNFVFSLPTRIVFGPGSIETVGKEAESIGKHALLVTGTTFARRSGLIERLRASLDQHGVLVTLYDEMGPNPRVDAIDRGGQIAREEGADLIIGLGGGSALDAAKAIALAACSARSIWDFARRSIDGVEPAVERALPVIQVPIVASTGSETNDTAVVFNERACMKATVTGVCLYARVAIVDPTLTFSVPPRFTAVGGMNIVSQMLESYLTRDEFPVTDRITEGLMRVVMDSLPRAMSRGEDLDARSNLSWVAALAPTIAISGQGGFMPLRAMAHPLSAHYGLDHGSALAALWPSYLRFALANRFRLPQVGRFKRYALLGRQIFGIHETDDEMAAEITTYRFTTWLKGMDIPTDLRQLGVEPEELSVLADEAVLVSGDGKRLPGGLTSQDIEHIYDGALRPS